MAGLRCLSKLSGIALIVLCWPGWTPVQAADPTPVVMADAPSFGESLREAHLKAQTEIERLRQEIGAREREQAERSESIDSLSRGLACPVSKGLRLARWPIVLGLFLVGIWVIGLYAMLAHVEPAVVAAFGPILRWMLAVFLGITLLCIGTVATLASGSSQEPMHAPGQDLANTLAQLEQSHGMMPWKQTLRSLEESRCEQIDIPDEVMRWLGEQCPEAEVIDPIVGMGPHRSVAIAAIHWASGDRPRALEALRDVVEIPFHPRLPLLRPCFRSAIRMLAMSGNSEPATKMMRQMLPFMDVLERLDMAERFMTCCPVLALDLVHASREGSRSSDETLRIAQLLMELNHSEEASQWIMQNIQMTRTTEGLAAIIDFTRIQRLPEVELQVLQEAMSLRRTPDSLIAMAALLNEREQIVWSKRVMQRAAEMETSLEGLLVIARTALDWQQYDTAKTVLRKIIDSFGFDGALKPVPDPGIGSGRRGTPSHENPGVAVVLALLTEQQGDTIEARDMYLEALNVELFNSVTCGGDIGAVNFTNFYYVWRFFNEQQESAMLASLESAGRNLEQSKIRNLTYPELDTLRQKHQELDRDIQEKKARSAELSAAWMKQRVAIVLCTVWLIGMACIMFGVTAYVLVRAIRFGRSLPHSKTLGTVLKILELKGFVLLPSLFAPIGILMIAHAQLLMSIMLTAIRLKPPIETGSGSRLS